jgi:hypothetical protein
MHVVREPVGLANTRVTEKTRRVILYRLVSKLDDHGPWNNEIPLLDKENKEDKSLFPSMTALLIIAKASILCKSGRLTFCCERGDDSLYWQLKQTLTRIHNKKRKKRKEERYGCLSLNTSSRIFPFHKAIISYISFPYK